MKKLMTLFVVVAMTVLGAVGAERITVDEVVNHYPWDGKVDCVTTLSGVESGYSYKGAFTLSVKKEGAIVRRVVTNDFAVANGTYTNTVDCVALFGAGIYPNGGITVELIKGCDRTGVPIGIVGDVLVIDVSAGSTVETYPTTELSGVDIGTFNCDVYKTDKIVLKKIPAGSYYCQPGADVSTTVSQKLTTKGFYIGVFPVTQRQYERVMGTNPSSNTADVLGNVAAHRPVEQLAWFFIRRNEDAGTTITASSPDSFLQRLVAKTGLPGFDLPTEAQWEMACRAGTASAYGAYWNGTAAAELTSLNLDEVAWYWNNSSLEMHAVGCKRPNAWGLYDMQGNCGECCRDIYVSTYSTSYVDVPCTEQSYDSGRSTVVRGGACNYTAEECRPSSRYCSDGYYPTGNGFRLSRTLP